MMTRARPLALLVLAACTYSPPATLAPERVPTPVAAPFDRAWTAVIDFFADRNVPIRTLDKTSGFIATEPLRVDADEGKPWADCGSSDQSPVGPERAVYNVRVRGDSTSATVRITVTWSSTFVDIWRSETRAIDCVTRGVWEADAEAKIKRIAEGQGRAP